MVDIETLGVRPTSIFLSIAAVQFDLETGEVGAKFKAIIDLKSAMDAGLTMDASTIEWWMKQDSSIMKRMFGEHDISPEHIVKVLHRFYSFCQSFNLQFFWGNSASFDLGILRNAYENRVIDTPWKYTNERCYRTVVKLFPDIKPEDREDHHDPLADCLYQIERLCMVWRHIKK